MIFLGRSDLPINLGIKRKQMSAFSHSVIRRFIYLLHFNVSLLVYQSCVENLSSHWVYGNDRNVLKRFLFMPKVIALPYAI